MCKRETKIIKKNLHYINILRSCQKKKQKAKGTGNGLNPNIGEGSQNWTEIFLT